MRQLTPCGAWWNRKKHLCEAGFGWDDNPRHNKGVYSTLSLRHIESSKFNNLSLERSNGRCPGV